MNNIFTYEFLRGHTEHLPLGLENWVYLLIMGITLFMTIWIGYQLWVGKYWWTK